jgi:hypothetical protein
MTLLAVAISSARRCRAFVPHQNGIKSLSHRRSLSALGAKGR